MLLSPGTDWQAKLRLQNDQDVVAWRSYWRRRGQQNRRVRQKLVDTCRHDCLFYINQFVWQYNPLLIGREIGPFWTYPFQDAFIPKIIKTIEEQRNGVCQKSREMGLTWIFAAIADWLCKFHSKKQVLMISRSEEMVDSQSPNSLFWKLDFIHEHQPDWLKGEIDRKKLYYGYGRTRSTITGEASTGRAGVGGRASLILVDEFSQIRDDWDVLHRTSDTSKCRWFNGTHLGLDTAFFKLCFDRNSFPDTRWERLTVHWADHPLKNPGLYRYHEDSNVVEVLDKTYAFPESFAFLRTPAPTGGPRPGVRSPWYDAECGNKGNDRAVAMDLDINPQGSIAQVFSAVRIAYLKAEFACPPYWEGDLVFHPQTRLPLEPLELVRQPGGPLKLWTHLNGGKPRPSQYKIGCDLATGSGATNSCGQILDGLLGEKVATYVRSDMKPEILARVMVLLCKLFADEQGQGAELVWECPGPGLNFGQEVLNSGYRNIWWRPTKETSGPRLFERKAAEIPGWQQSPDGKRFLIDRYCTALEGRKYISRDEDELRETLEFKWTPDGRTVEHSAEANREDPSGARVNHGDRVIAAALAWMLCLPVGRQEPEAEANQGPPVNSLAWRRLLWEDQDRDPEERKYPWFQGSPHPSG